MNQSTQTIPDRGYDADVGNRPGVPMEARPRPVQGARELPPVVGTAQPLRGVSGLLRRVAYGMPQHEARRWALLLFADRVDALEHGVWRGRALAAVLGLGLATVAGLRMRGRGRRKWRVATWRTRWA